MTSINSFTTITIPDESTTQYDNLLKQLDDFNIWPEYILNDTVNLTYWEAIYTQFKDYQFFLMDGDTVVGNGNCIALHLTESEAKNLNDGGWDWALKKAFSDLEDNLIPNTLCGLQIGIHKDYQGKGISRKLVQQMKSIAVDRDFNHFILPIRPNQKSNYPLISMEEYIKWKTVEGLPYDAWIRTHLKSGAELVNICSHSMYVEGTVEEWEQWTGLHFQTSGSYTLPFALNPIQINLEENKGVYIEPNIWMRYPL